MGEITQVPEQCKLCRHLLGQIHGDNMLVCGMHPYGPECDNCPDYEQLSKDAPRTTKVLSHMRPIYSANSRIFGGEPLEPEINSICEIAFALGCSPAGAAIAIRDSGLSAEEARDRVLAGELTLGDNGQLVEVTPTSAVDTGVIRESLPLSGDLLSFRCRVAPPPTRHWQAGGEARSRWDVLLDLLRLSGRRQ